MAIHLYLLPVALLLLLSSCEKVVYIDLNTSNPRPVVEADITDQAGPYTVKLSRSVNYYDSNVFPPITDATVSITDNAGNSELLRQTTDGIYQTKALQGIPGRTYTLKIFYNGNEYDAISTMPDPVAIDSVGITKNSSGGNNRNNPGYSVTAFFNDPAGKTNYYRLQLSSNDTNAIDQTRYRLASDKLTDGSEMSITYNTKLLPNDSLTVRLGSVDKSSYDFLTTFRNVVGGSTGFLSAPPSNPVTNITNGGLGYFAAYPVSIRELIIQQ